MSLLMDALRKAEESKKKAEQGELSPQETGKQEPGQQTSPPVEDSSSDDLSLTPREDSEPSSPPDEYSAEGSNAANLDVLIEFEEPQPARNEPQSPGQDSDIAADFQNESTPEPELETEPGAPAVPEPAEEPTAPPVLATPLPAETSNEAVLDSFEDALEDELEPPRPVPRMPVAKPRARPAPVASRPRAGETPPRLGEKHQEDRRKANAVFAAKRPWQKNRRNIQLAGGGIAAILVVGIGVYFYLNIGGSGGVGVNIDPSLLSQDGFNQQQMSEDELLAAAPIVAPASDNPTPPPASNVAPLSEPGIAEVVAVEQELIPAPELATPPPPDLPVPDSGLQAQSTVPAVAQEAETQAVATAAASGDSVTTPPEGVTEASPNLISFVRRATAPALPEALQAAYLAYSRGDMAQAREQYQQTLVDAPLNRDALLGMAAIAAVENNRNEAMELYSRLLTRDPSDPVARAGLLGLLPNGSASDQERELRSLMERHPAVPTIAFALGNFYA
ncbi:MAG: hypothetical protein RL120_12730, partial [Gammaproteobacteria bacterium]